MTNEFHRMFEVCPICGVTSPFRTAHHDEEKHRWHSAFGHSDSLQVAQTVVECSKRNGADNAEYVKAGKWELRRRLGMLGERECVGPYEDMAVALLEESGIDLEEDQA